MIFLHIGAMKTGTTFLQDLMEANRDHLLAAGVLVTTNRAEQRFTTRDILGPSDSAAFPSEEHQAPWPRQVARMLAHRGTAAVFSMESLSFANRRQALRVVTSLDDAEVHVVLTVRDAGGALPSQWQTHVRSGGTISWPKFAKNISDNVAGESPVRGSGSRVFLRTQGIPRMLDAWGGTVPAERLHVITVPRPNSDPMLLWERFASVVGVDPQVCPYPAAASKPSLGYPSADLMRRLNVRLGKVPREQYRPTLKVGVGVDILPQRAQLELPAQLDRRTGRFARNWNAGVQTAIRASGANVVGDLRDLPTRFSPEFAQTLSARLSYPADSDVLAAAGTAREGLLVLIRTRENHLQAVGERILPAHIERDDVAPLDRWMLEDHPVDAAVDELSSLVRMAIGLQDRLEIVGTIGPRHA